MGILLLLRLETAPGLEVAHHNIAVGPPDGSGTDYEQGHRCDEYYHQHDAKDFQQYSNENLHAIPQPLNP